MVVFALLFVALAGLFTWLAMLFLAFTKPVPTEGGVYTEGIVGEPMHINPILTQATEVDADMVQLVYSSLFSYDDTGKLRPSLAEGYELLEDGKKYVVKLHSGVKWHDGQDLTADDVLFTFRTIQDPSYRSPLRANWQGVEVSKDDDLTVVFSLKKAYFDFLENLTVGIVPKHVWDGIAPEKFSLTDVNLNPIGSGPFRVEGFKKDSNGTILSYELRAFPQYFEGAPFLQKIVLYFYGSEEDLLSAYRRREILAMSNVTPATFPEDLKEQNDTVVRDIVQPRVFAVFLNEKKNAALAEEPVRRALALATDREALVRDVLDGHGEAAYSLFSPGAEAYSSAGEASAYNPDEAMKVLEDAGWKLNTDGVREKGGVRLEFDIATPNWEELVKTAHMVENEWNEIGAHVTVTVLENVSDAQRTIRSREYAALLYGLATTFEPDPYSFWHSSQTGELEHNFALFSDKRADELLSSVREELNADTRSGMYREFQEILATRMPAVFLYSPRYVYVQRKSVHGFSAQAINTPASRFQDAAHWYMSTKRVRK
ncbi:MAG: ABC transporter substrate-binding protein [Candidatus Moraniibacteriota bacterium]